ncbi:MAG: HAD-IC family P-type ATPase, partial [Methanoregulaceae archaeon]|nr:HAD-IC family P-type ATPase [Methanoregulaceae archaeon]
MKGGEPDRKSDRQYHTIPLEDLFGVLNSSAEGLTGIEAEKRQVTYGKNDVSHVRKRPVVIQFLAHFKNLLVIILLIAAAISVFLGETVDAVIIIVIIVASVTLDFFQEYKAENAAELLRQKIISRASVVRDGKQQELPITDLVPGDVIFLSAGDLVPADARLLDARDFFVNQSALTGEPFPIEKDANPEDVTKPITEADNYIFLGTAVVSGTAHA